MPMKMKRTLCLMLALVMALALAQPALAAGVTYMPGVTAEMSDPAYWAAMEDDPEEVILTPEEIEAFNADTALREGTMVMDLRQAPEGFDGPERNEMVASSAASDAEYYLGWTYKGNGEPADQAYFDEMIANCSDPTATGWMPIRYAVAVERTLLQVFPSDQPILDDPNDVDFDYQALSGIKVNEPMILYTTSADGQYYLARIASCSGWVKAEDVAICADREEWLSAWDLPSEKLLVVYGNKEYTDESISHPETARRMLTAGTTLELVTDLQPDQLIGNRSPYHNYVVYLPVRRADGSYEKQMALIPETAHVSVGYLPLTEENIALAALQNLGDAYGWGGMMDVDDCSGMICTIYRCFGLSIGRNGNWQANMNIEKIDMHGMCLEEKRLILDELPLGASLCFDGHEMMYLGKVDGQYYVVSTVSSIVSPYTGSILRTRDVMINTLEVKRGSGKTWLGALNMVFMPCYAKLEGKSYDFPQTQWYHDGVTWCISGGVMPGLDIDDIFGIGMDADRADLAYGLWMLAGAPVPETAPEPETAPDATPAPTPEPTPEPPYPFNDVAADDPARIAIAWAAEQGFMAGENGAFDPNGTISGPEAYEALEKLAGTQSLTLDGTVSEYLDEDAVVREDLAMAFYGYGQIFDQSQSVG